MAEVLGIASGIAGLISITIEVFGITYKYVNGVHNASHHARRFLKELEDLQTVLLLFQKAAKEIDQSEIFGDAGSSLLLIRQSIEYIEILEKIRAKLEQQKSGSSFHNAMKALKWPFTEKETLSLAESLHPHLQIYNTALAFDSLTVGKLTLSEVRQSNVSQEGKRIEAILDWLSPLNMYQKHQDVLSRRHGVTGSWLLVDPVFQGWVHSEYSQRTLWCPGDPGTGKTVITSVVIDHLLDNNASKVAYVYCDYKDQAAQTASNLTACLIRQILGRPRTLPQQVEELYSKLGKEKRRPSFDGLSKLLVALCNQSEGTYIIVDALDECEAMDERRLLLPVLEVLPNTSTRLFVTSRPNKEDIIHSFGKASQISITAPELDLRQYVRERLEARRDLVDILSPELKEKIVSTVSTRVSGMFLLATLQIDRILASRTIKRIKSALTSMPRELDELYRQTLERIRNQAGDDGALGMRILSWITHARRPLSVNELRYGLAVEYKDDDDDDHEEDVEELDQDNLHSPGSLVDVCAGLVIIDSTSSIIRLVHYSTQEYFDKESLHLFRDAEIHLSRACLTYLSYKTVAESVSRPLLGIEQAHMSHPFLDYAAHHWFSHVRSGLLLETPSPVYLKAVTHLKSSDSIFSLIEFLYIVRTYRAFFRHTDATSWYDNYIDKKSSAMQMASYLGLAELVAVLLDHNTGSWPGADSSFVFAAYGGEPDVVKLLLRHGARLDAKLVIKNTAIKPVTALTVACLLGSVSVVKVLIENGADIHDQSLADLPPLHAATLANPDLVQFLLNEGVDINARDSMGDTACHYATSVTGRTNPGGYMDIRDNDRRIALNHAVALLTLESIQLLLDRGADASAKNHNGQTTRTLLEQELSKSTTLDVRGPEYLQLGQQLIQRLLQLEQQSIMSPTNSP